MDYLNKHHPKFADAFYAAQLWIALAAGMAFILFLTVVTADVRVFLGLGSIFLMVWGVFYYLKS